MSRQAQWRQPKVCEACGRSYMAARSDSRSCGPTCKKRLQRGKAKAVPLMAAEAFEDNEPRPIIAELMRAWPQGCLVLHKQSRGPKKPGRVNWNSAAGDELKRRFGCRQFCRPETACVPVEELTGVFVRLVGDLSRA